MISNFGSHSCQNIPHGSPLQHASHGLLKRRCFKAIEHKSTVVGNMYAVYIILPINVDWCGQYLLKRQKCWQNLSLLSIYTNPKNLSAPNNSTHYTFETKIGDLHHIMIVSLCICHNSVFDTQPNQLRWPAFKNFFQRSKVSKLTCAFFGMLNPNILSIFLGQVKLLRYNWCTF